MDKDDLVQVGWVRWDGDEFHAFTYFTPEDRRRDPEKLTGFLPVYAKREDAEGA